MKKHVLTKALCVMLAVLLVIAMPVVPGHGVEPGACATTMSEPPVDKGPPDGEGY